jgi:diguanylate cyclase
MSEEMQWLCRGAVSLTLMLKGYDPQLDISLDTLRSRLKEQNFRLDAFQEALTEVEEIHDQLESLRTEGILNFRRISEILLDSEQDKALLQPLQIEHPGITDVLNVAEPLVKKISITPRTEDVSNQTTQQQIDDLRHRLVHYFRSLLQSLILQKEESEVAQQLEQQFSKNPKWSELEKLIKQAMELLKKHLVEEKKQFEGYLSEVNTKLSRINQIVETDSVTLQELKEINQAFNTSLQEQMTETRSKLENDHRVDALKGELLESLDGITTRLKTYQTAYSEKLHSLQNSKEQMTLHIQQLERENLNLLAELDKERKLSALDTLTQLPNRQGFNTRVAEEISRADRYQHFLSLAIIDIDFFKRINDDFGHLIGDKVLRMIAKEMKKKCRGSDFLARFGGEEFVLLLPQTSLNDAAWAVDKIRKHIETRPFHYQNKPVPLTISAGVAQFNTGEDIESCMARADASLYSSKRTGRNKVTADTSNLN